MDDAPRPVLSYDRIDVNKRRTRWLLVAFTLLLLPVGSGITVYVMPFVLMFGVQAYHSLRAPATPAANAELMTWAWMLEVGIMAIALIITVVALTSVVLFLVSHYGSRAVLRLAHAKPLDRETDRDIVRVIENLCIGAGLPLPDLYVIESAAPNAFAIGRDPEHASLVLTRGLITLLDRRELEGVIAHELSHIGNHDIALSTTLAALVSTLSIPFRIFSAILSVFPVIPLGYRIGAGLITFKIVLFIAAFYVQGLLELLIPSDELPFPPLLRLWGLHAMLAPAYIMFVAPLLAMVIRQAVSRQREFLADADAVLLTRDPEGLALALVKVTTAQGQRLRVGEGTVHFYFTDPLGGGNLLHRLFPSHPSVERRIELLARMGSGVSPADLRRGIAEAEAARIAAAAVAAATPVSEPVTPLPAKSTHAPSDDATGLEERPQRAAATAPLYEQPDGWARVLEQLSPEDDVSPISRQGAFIRVVANGLTGYVSSSAPLPAIVAFNAKGLS